MITNKVGVVRLLKLVVVVDPLAVGALEVAPPLAANPPQVLITDIEMSLMSGRELCETIAAQYPDRSWPIFIVTSAPDLVHREWSSQLPDVHFVEKPVSIQQLTLALEQRLAASQDIAQ